MVSYILPRSFTYNTARFRRIFWFHFAAILALAVLGFMVLHISNRYLPVGYVLLLCSVIIFAMMLLGAFPPLRTAHSVDGEFVVLRQGLGFKLAVPLRRISKARRLESVPGSPGIRVDRPESTLMVLASREGAVRIELREGVRYRGAVVDRIVVDVQDPEGFISCIRDRKRDAALMRRLDTHKRPAGARELAGIVVREGKTPSPEGAEEEGAGGEEGVKEEGAGGEEEVEEEEEREEEEEKEEPARAEKEPEEDVETAIRGTRIAPAKARERGEKSLGAAEVGGKGSIEGAEVGGKRGIEGVEVRRKRSIKGAEVGGKRGIEGVDVRRERSIDGAEEEEVELELVPALPSREAAPARIVRIPKRKP